MPDVCKHISSIKDVTASGDGCVECLRTGDTWVHLRLCMDCGHVGCCDDSKNRHATKHFHKTKHPVIFSYEPGEAWGYCYVDDIMFETSEPARTAYPPPARQTVAKNTLDKHNRGEQQ